MAVVDHLPGGLLIISQAMTRCLKMDGTASPFPVRSIPGYNFGRNLAAYLSIDSLSGLSNMRKMDIISPPYWRRTGIAPSALLRIMRAFRKLLPSTVARQDWVKNSAVPKWPRLLKRLPRQKETVFIAEDWHSRSQQIAKNTVA